MSRDDELNDTNRIRDAAEEVLTNARRSRQETQELLARWHAAQIEWAWAEHDAEFLCRNVKNDSD